ncbi:MAG: MBL fold metallo-hydrolase, partial [candidate division Zixibacteria bacterium]|nr:MBL fold metallo-hydrolase [candidate division Zixibacteria bacterium]
MKLLKLFLAVSLSLLFSSTLFAQEEPKYDIEKLSDKIYKFTVVQNGFPVAVIASIGDDGILLVDTGQADAAENLKKTIQSIDNRIPSYIISTHSHADHIGGNLMFGADPI